MAEETRSHAVSSTTGYRVIGTRPPRPDGADKVTGRAVFGADVKLPGMLQARVLRSPHAHARIKTIDTSRAEALEGVMAIVTARDVWSLDRRNGQPEPAKIEPDLKYFRDRYIASDKVLYCGHPVAAVAAVDQYVAEEAINLIQVEYEVLPPVLDVVEAMKDSSRLLHEEMVTVSLGKPTGRRSNVAEHIQLLKGNPDEGFAEAEVVLEREYRTTHVHQGYLEPHVATADWSADGNVTVWASQQGPFVARDDIARLLQHPVAKIRVIPTEVGGGFGGKGGHLYVQPVAALLSRKAGRPVRLGMSRAETFEATGPTPASYIKLKMGATRDGRLVAATAQVMFEAGAFPGSPVGVAARCMFGAYEIPHCQIDGYDVVVNKLKAASYRAPGATQGAFAVESVIDEICEEIGMDPLQFRLKNAAKEGTRSVFGNVFPRIGFAETMRAALETEHYRTPLVGAHRGRGVACGFWPTSAGPVSCTLSVNGDGTVNLALGSVDLQGNKTGLAMQVAEVLGIEVSRIQPSVGDTNSVGYTGPSVGSRATYSMGLTAIEVAREVIRQMGERAARIWGIGPDSVSFADGVFSMRGDPAKRLSFGDVAARLMATGGPVSVAKGNLPTGPGATVGAHIVDVEVDPETGKVQILRYTVAIDAGTSVHPGLVEGQMHGAVTQGIGWALWEGYVYDERGKLQNRSFLDYKIPTALDLPMFDTVIVEVPNPGHPFGVRGVGEVPIVGAPAAIANAIHNATGVRMRQLPITPARILQATGVID